MSIPKTIHYCWFGRGEMPPLAKKCMKSWKKYCPDCDIICWNEDNFDFSENEYAAEAYRAGKWAFVSDYVRLRVIEKYGGIYLDTDVEIIKPIDKLLECGGFLGLDERGVVCTGLGFAASAGNEAVRAMLADYDGIHFVKEDGSYDITPCTERNTATLARLGFDRDNPPEKFMDMTFLPSEYLCPKNFYTGKTVITENTYSIHHYDASWISPTARRTMIAKRILGVKLYDKLYGKFLHKFKWLEW